MAKEFSVDDFRRLGGPLSQHPASCILYSLFCFLCSVFCIHVRVKDFSAFNTLCRQSWRNLLLLLLLFVWQWYLFSALCFLFSILYFLFTVWCVHDLIFPRKSFHIFLQNMVFLFHFHLMIFVCIRLLLFFWPFACLTRSSWRHHLVSELL